MPAKKTEAPQAVVGATVTIGGTHGHRPLSVQVIEIGNYVFYRGIQSGALYEACGRCDGFNGPTGHINGFEHVAGGVCFSCGGAGHVGVKASTADIEGLREVVRKRLLAKAARERKAEREAEQARQAAAAWAEANAEVAEGLAAIRERIAAANAAVEGQEDEYGEPVQPEHGITGPLFEFAFKCQREALTEKQTAFAASLLAQQAETDEWEAAKARAKAEKIAASQHLGEVDAKLTITGTVKVATIVEVPSFRIPGNMDSKPMIVLDVDGSEVKVFSQAQWAWDAEKGQALTLTGTVKRHSEYQGVAQTELGGRIKVG